MDSTEAARRLGISPIEVRRIIRSGALPTVGSGKRYQLTEEDLTAIETYRQKGKKVLPPEEDEEIEEASPLIWPLPLDPIQKRQVAQQVRARAREQEDRLMSLVNARLKGRPSL